MTTITENEVARLQQKLALAEAERDSLAAENGVLRQDLAKQIERNKSRWLIDQAKAKLMTTSGCNEQQAYRTLQRAAMTNRTRLVEEAQRIIDTITQQEMAQEKPHERRLRSDQRVRPPHR